MSVWEKANWNWTIPNSCYFSLSWTSCIYVNRGRHLYECYVLLLVWGKAPIRTRIIVIFHLHWLFLKTLIKNIIYCQTVHVFGTYVLICKNVCEDSLPSFLLLVIFCLDPCQLFNSASLSLVGDHSLVHKLRVMAAVELHLNATYAQHLALKSVYEKRW